MYQLFIINTILNLVFFMGLQIVIIMALMPIIKSIIYFSSITNYKKLLSFIDNKSFVILYENKVLLFHDDSHHDIALMYEPNRKCVTFFDKDWSGERGIYVYVKSSYNFIINRMFRELTNRLNQKASMTTEAYVDFCAMANVTKN